MSLLPGGVRCSPLRAEPRLLPRTEGWAAAAPPTRARFHSESLMSAGAAATAARSFSCRGGELASPRRPAALCPARADLPQLQTPCSPGARPAACSQNTARRPPSLPPRTPGLALPGPLPTPFMGQLRGRVPSSRPREGAEAGRGSVKVKASGRCRRRRGAERPR